MKHIIFIFYQIFKNKNKRLIIVKQSLNDLKKHNQIMIIFA